MEQTKSSSLRRERVLSHIADCWWLWILKAVIVLLVLCIIVPFFWMITSSVKTTQEYLTSPIVWFPRDPQWSNYAEVMVDLQFYRYIINSLILAALSVLLSVFSSAFVAFGFSRFNFKGSSVWFGIMIATMMLPGQVTVVPQFLLFKEIGWTKNFLPLVVPQICGAAGNVLLITQFMKGIPHEIDDAAKVDGAGSLTIEAQAGHGIVSKDDLTVTGGSYTITAASHGLSGKDSIAIANGTFAIISGKDGIHAENTDDLSLGILYIADGDYTITAQGDAISAQGSLQIDGGTFNLYTGEGSASMDMTSSDIGQIGGGLRGGMDAQTDVTTAAAEEDTVSQKGIKGESTYTINGGTFMIDSADDCLHAGGAMNMTAGEFTLNSGDDAVHSDDALVIQNGTFTIPYCYEGIEGLSITIEDGTFDITSNDDGLNAGGGVDSSGFGGFNGLPQDTFASSSDSFITINGGTFTIVSSGDSVDSNGDLTINGGTLELTCNGNGDTALDCDGTYTNNGGDVTTNDGSENNPGQMGGGKGGTLAGAGRQNGTNGGGRTDGQTISSNP